MRTGDAHLARGGLLAAAALLLAVSACGGGDSGQVRQPLAALPEDVIAFGGREDGAFGLYLMTPDGAGLRRLTEEEGFVYFPRWSPQGDRIAYIVRVDPDVSAAALLRVADVATGKARTLSESASPFLFGPAVSWSPDGTRLAFSELADTALIRIVDVESGEMLDAPAIEGIAPDWSPTEDRLVLVSGQNEAAESDLYAANADGSDLKTLLQRSGQESSPRWAPDGEWIAFWGGSELDLGTGEVYVVQRDGSDLRKVGDGGSPVWSPDGLRLAYTGLPLGQEGPDTGGDLDVFVVEVEGGTREPVSGAVTRDGWPSWAPSGERLVYLALADLQTGFLCVVDLAAGSSDCLDLGDIVPSAPAWSPR